MGWLAGQRVSRRAVVTLSLLALLPWGLQKAEAASKAKPAPIAPIATAAQASARLGFDLLSQLGKGKGNDPNPVVSPASLTAALAVLDLGASPKFHAALVKTLRLDTVGDSGDLKSLRASLVPLIDGSKADGPLTGISAVYFDPRGGPKPAALDELKQAGVQADVRDLSDAKTIDDINALVKDRTKGLIPTLIDEPLRKGGLVVLNALHFKDDWRTAFDPAQTTQMDFHRIKGGDAKVAMMQSGSGHWLARQDDRFIAVALPYQTKGYDLLLLTTKDKPAALADFAPAASWLTGEGFAESEGTVSLPRLSIKAGADLRGSLDKLGLDPAVRAPDALSGFLTTPQKIDKIIQKVVITVDEKGTEAAAATAVTSRSLAMPATFSFVADKPFLFALRDETSGQVLMAGYIGDAAKAQ
ncbi:serine protease inhibitor [Labrys miyagiensis]|uniref:Serine protease inhibitor n=1 Tax=Labrys miyagiensis TaxID=346912 RepID=A0ABQ6CUN7_9HYPH|nr:serpin family protein [Labrys miyagiensis]GLS23302.1 serine protease inhibitor [Labrys miyagiensis]